MCPWNNVYDRNVTTDANSKLKSLVRNVWTRHENGCGCASGNTGWYGDGVPTYEYKEPYFNTHSGNRLFHFYRNIRNNEPDFIQWVTLSGSLLPSHPGFWLAAERCMVASLPIHGTSTDFDDLRPNHHHHGAGAAGPMGMWTFAAAAAAVGGPVPRHVAKQPQRVGIYGRPEHRNNHLLTPTDTGSSVCD